VDPLPLAPPAVDGVREPGRLAVHTLGALRIVPEIGRRRLDAQLGRACFESGEVKDASRARARARRGHARARAALPERLPDRPSPAPSARTITEARTGRERITRRARAIPCGAERRTAGSLPSYACSSSDAWPAALPRRPGRGLGRDDQRDRARRRCTRASG